MTEKTLTTIFTIGQYSAFLTWTVLAILIARQILRRNYVGIKIASLYAINSISFVLAYGLVIKLALIVMTPIEKTKEKSIETLHKESINFLFDFILIAVLTTCALAIFNVIYLKYFAKTELPKHTLTLFVADLTILSLASYISTELYYTGLLQEIYRHFS